MANVATVVRNLTRGDVFQVTEPDLGRMKLLIPGPRKTTEIEPRTQQFVFTHPSGRMIGFNYEAGGRDDWEECRLVADTDGYHHVLLLHPDGNVIVYTRREPGQPGDWERRGQVSNIKVIGESADCTEQVG